MHRTGGPGLANASQMPVNTGDSEGHPSLMEKHNTYEHSTSLQAYENKQPEPSRHGVSDVRIQSLSRGVMRWLKTRH